MRTDAEHNSVKIVPHACTKLSWFYTLMHCNLTVSSFRYCNVRWLFVTPANREFSPVISISIVLYFREILLSSIFSEEKDKKTCLEQTCAVSVVLLLFVQKMCSYLHADLIIIILKRTRSAWSNKYFCFQTSHNVHIHTHKTSHTHT